MRGTRQYWLRLGLVSFAVVALVAVIVQLGSSRPSTASNPPGPVAAEPTDEGGDACEESADPKECEREGGYFDPRKEAKFERTIGEADRGGADNPAAEQVDNRAYPRHYVDDKLALRG